jgi:hypothetical protein
VSAVPTFHIENLDLLIKQKIWQKMVNGVHGHIVSTVNSKLGKKIPNFINKKLEELNAAQISILWIRSIAWQLTKTKVKLKKS